MSTATASEAPTPKDGELFPELAKPKNLKISAGAYLLMAKLRELSRCKGSREKGHIYATQEWLAGELGVRSVRTIQRWLSQLHALGLLHWRRGHTNQYHLDTPSPLEQGNQPEDEHDKNVAFSPSKCRVEGDKNVVLITTKMSRSFTYMKKEEERREEESAGAPAEPARGVPPKTIPPKHSDPNHRLLVDFFCTSWRAKYGADFPFGANRGANAKGVVAILAAVKGDLAEAKRIVREYLDDHDQWIAANRHPLLYLAKYVQRYIGNGEPLVNEHGLYTRPRPLTPEEIALLQEEAKADAGNQPGRLQG